MSSIVEPKDKHFRPQKTFTYGQAFVLVIISTILFSVAAYLIGEHYFREGQSKIQLTKQLDYYQQLVERDPGNLQNRISLAYTQHLNGESKGAISTLESVLDVDKNYYDAYLNLGIIHIETKNYYEAVVNLKKAVEISPNDYKGYLNLGIAYYKMRDYNQAIESLEKAKQVNPSGAEIRYHTAVTLELDGSKELAMEEYAEALRFNPNYGEAKEALRRLQNN